MKEESFWESLWVRKYTSLLFRFSYVAIYFYILLRFLIGVSSIEEMFARFLQCFRVCWINVWIEKYTCTVTLMRGNVIYPIDTTLMHLNIWMNEVYNFCWFTLRDLITRRWACLLTFDLATIKFHTTDQRFVEWKRYMKKDYWNSKFFQFEDEKWNISILTTWHS